MADAEILFLATRSFGGEFSGWPVVLTTSPARDRRDARLFQIACGRGGRPAPRGVLPVIISAFVIVGANHRPYRPDWFSAKIKLFHAVQNTRNGRRMPRGLPSGGCQKPDYWASFSAFAGTVHFLRLIISPIMQRRLLLPVERISQVTMASSRYLMAHAITVACTTGSRFAEF